MILRALVPTTPAVAHFENNPNDPCDGGTGFVTLCDPSIPTGGGQCDDGKPCTEDLCDDGACVNECLTGPACDPGPSNQCDTYCVEGRCIVDCDDGNPCTNDACEWIRVDPPFQDCVHEAIDCNDHNVCTDDECIGGVCYNTPPPEAILCDDEDECTENDLTCEGSNDECIGTEIDCEDDDLCTTNERCDSAIGCLYDTTDCNDDDPCTIDTCDPQTGACEYEEASPLEYPEYDCAPYACTVNIDLPQVVLLNDDDDNRNGIPDKDDWEGADAPLPIPEEDDLLMVLLDVSGCPSPPCGYGEQPYWYLYPVWRYHFYLSPDRSDLVTYPHSQPWPPPASIWIEGVNTTTACGTRCSFAIDRDCCLACCVVESDPIITAKVSSVAWQKAPDYPDNPDLGTCPNNGGVRIFPGKISPTDSTPTNRQKVDLVATVEPPIAGVTVYFKVWDVDDPFNENNPDMPDVGLIDNDTNGHDNRPDGEDPYTFPPVNTYELFDGNGHVIGAEARVTFTVSMQPGNNYRAGASLLQDALDQSPTGDMQDVADALNDQGGDFADYSVPLTWSPMLTVWRKLTVEVDSMDEESLIQADRESNGLEWGRFVVPPPSGDIPAPIQVDVPDQGFTTLLGYMVPGPVPCDSSYDNRWEGGALVPPGPGPEYLLVRNSCVVMGPQTVSQFIVWGNPADLTQVTSVIRDDDPYFTGGAPRQLPQTSVLQADIINAYSDAYIEIVEADAVLNLTRLVTFQSNLHWAELSFEYTWGTGVAATKDLSSTASYWTRYVVMCYQAGTATDFDSDGFENGAISVNVLLPTDAPYPTQQLSNLWDTMDSSIKSGVTVSLPFYDAMTTVYVETIRDKIVDDDTARLWQYIAHEIGHQTQPRLSEDEEHAEGGLMSGEGGLQNIPALRGFTGSTLRRFREVEEW